MAASTPAAIRIMINSEKKIPVLSVKAGVLLMTAVAVARGTSFMFSKQLLAHLEPLNLLGMRSLIAFGVLVAVFGKRVTGACRENHQNIAAGALLGFVYFVVMVLELNGLKYTTTATASFIENSAVVLVPVAEAMILRRLPSWSTIICAAICLAGVGFIAGGGFISGLGIGEIMCSIAALVYTSAIIITDREAKKCDAFVVGILYVGFMGVFGLIGSFITEAPKLPQDSRDWSMLLALAIVCSAFGFALQPVAQKVISAETAGILTAANPLTAALLGSVILHERFGLTSIVGAVLILTGITIHNTYDVGKSNKYKITEE